MDDGAALREGVGVVTGVRSDEARALRAVERRVAGPARLLEAEDALDELLLRVAEGDKVAVGGGRRALCPRRKGWLASPTRRVLNS